MTIEALKRLVAAVDAIPEEIEGWIPDSLTDALIDAKKAIAELEKQEPIGYLEIEDIEDQREYPHNCRAVNLWYEGGEGLVAVYTHPQPKD